MGGKYQERRKKVKIYNKLCLYISKALEACQPVLKCTCDSDI